MKKAYKYINNTDKEKSRQVLLNEYHFTTVTADLILEKFPVLNKSLTEALHQWLDNRNVADTEVGGLSIKEMLKIHGYHFLLAIKDLGILSDPNLTPEQYSRLRETLSKPMVLK